MSWHILGSTAVLAEANGSNGTCPDGVAWMLRVFAQCVENPVQLAGFWIGIISMVLWLGPIFSQLLENYKRQSTEALSIYFLLFWFMGDAANLVGAVLTGQLEIQIFIGMYYILQDFALLAQFMYYSGREKYRSWSQRAMADVGSSAQTLPCLFVFCLLSFAASFQSLPFHAAVPDESFRPAGRKLLHNHFFISAKDEAGYIIGIFSAISYFCGRVPQLIKNHRRGTTDGVSILMFIIIVLANLTYGLSVILAGSGLGWAFILRHAPWLAGSLGCCAMDALVIFQALYFDHWRPRRYQELEGNSGLPT